jgi:hypothetical protein
MHETCPASGMTPSVAWNAIEWLIPNVKAVLTGDFFNLTSNNQKRSDGMKKYIKYMLFRKQNGKKIVKHFIWSGCVYHYGVLKVYHHEDYDTETEHYESLTAEQFAALAQDPQVTVTKFTESAVQAPLDWLVSNPVTEYTYENVKAVRKKPKFSGPKVEVLPPWELEYVPGYPDLSKCPYVAHKFKLTLDEIRKREIAGKYRKGSYDKVKHKIDNRPDDEIITGELDRIRNVDGFSGPDSVTDSQYSENTIRLNQNEVFVRECYINADIDKDGLLEPCIVTICEDVVLSDIEENPYGEPIFIKASAHEEPFKFEGFPLPLMVRHEQMEQTNLRRLIVDSAAESTYRTVVTSNPNMATQWSQRVIGDAIIGNPDSFKEVAVNSPSQFCLRAYEMNEGRIENKTGITRYNQGLDADSLNKTAHGVNAIMSASQMRMKDTTENFADAFEQLIRAMIRCIQLYPPTDWLRVVQEQIQVDLDDLSGQYEIDIDIGIGPQEKQFTAQMLDQHVEFLVKVGIPNGLATPVHLAKTILRKYEVFGLDTRDLLLPIEEIEQRIAVMEQQQMDDSELQKIDAAIKQMSAQGMPAQQVGMEVLNMIAGAMDARETAGVAAAGGGGGAGGNAPTGGPQGLPGPGPGVHPQGTGGPPTQ